MIRKEAYVHSAVMDELRRIIEDSEIMAEVCRYDIYLFVKKRYTAYTAFLHVNFVLPLILKSGNKFVVWLTFVIWRTESTVFQVTVSL